MNLGSFAVVLVLASKCLILEAVEHFGDSLGRLGQHGLQGHSGPELAMVPQVHNAVFHHRRDDDVVTREFTDTKLAHLWCSGSRDAYL